MTGEGVGFMAYRQKTGNLAQILCPSLNVIKYFLCSAPHPLQTAGKHLEMKSNSLWSCWWLVAGAGVAASRGRGQRQSEF